MLTFLQASVSHELMTPIKCIGSFSQELVFALSSNPSLKYKAELIVSTSKILLSQIKFLLDKSMIDQKVFAPQLQKLSLKKLLRDTTAIMDGQAKIRCIKLVMIFKVDDVEL